MGNGAKKNFLFVVYGIIFLFIICVTAWILINKEPSTSNNEITRKKSEPSVKLVKKTEDDVHGPVEIVRSANDHARISEMESIKRMLDIVIKDNLLLPVSNNWIVMNSNLFSGDKYISYQISYFDYFIKHSKGFGEEKVTVIANGENCTFNENFPPEKMQYYYINPDGINYTIATYMESPRSCALVNSDSEPASGMYEIKYDPAKVSD